MAVRRDQPVVHLNFTNGRTMREILRTMPFKAMLNPGASGYSFLRNSWLGCYNLVRGHAHPSSPQLC
eukprot:786468-Karenia_brevis.AAC.2